MDTWSAAVMLFLIMDPLGNLPIFMSVLKSIEPRRRQMILIRELVFALVILFVFLFSGQSVLNFLNVGQETVSIAGGIILFLIALECVGAFARSCWTRQRAHGPQSFISDFHATGRDR